MDGGGEGYGAARGNRTPDPIITNDVLYQLSYCGAHARALRSAGAGGIYAISDATGNSGRLGSRADVN